MTTKSQSIKWVIELYAFDSSIPSADDFGGSGSSPTSFIGSASAALDIAKTVDRLTKKDPSSKSDINVSFGLKSLSMHRSKANPDSQCQFTMIGPIPKDMYPGTWIVITYIGDKNGSPFRITRYIGQIHTIMPEYSVGPDNLIHQTTSVVAREWSACLTIPIRYDAYSMQKSQQIGLSTGSVFTEKLFSDKNDLLSKAGLDTKGPELEIESLMKSVNDPFEMAHSVLKMISCVSDVDLLEEPKNKTITMPEFSVTPPKVPVAVIERLGIKVDSVNKHPYSSGFIKVLTGILQDGFLNKGDWDGIFTKTDTIDNLKEKMKSGYKSTTDRPKTPGCLMVTQLERSAWELLNEFCDNSINEVYTDVFFQEKDVISATGKMISVPKIISGPQQCTLGSMFDKNGLELQKEEQVTTEIVAQPVIVIRDKPYLLKVLKNHGLGMNSPVFDKWTYFDDLPRIRIDNSSILNVRFTNTFMNSPNYIRVNLAMINSNEYQDTAIAAINSFTRLLYEQYRFGGNSFSATTQYAGVHKDEGGGSTPDMSSIGTFNGILQSALNTGTPFSQWYGKMRDLLRMWHSYTYRMASATMVVQDDDIALSVGFNAQFKMFDYNELVGHITDIQYQYSVGDDGLSTSMTIINLERIVREIEDIGLDFVPAEDWGRLSRVPAKESIRGLDIKSLDADALSDIGLA